MRRFTVTLFLAWLLSGVGLAENLLRNPGFEQPIPGVWVQRTPSDPSRTLSWDDQRFRTGHHSARIENKGDVLSRWRCGQDGSIKVAPGTELKLEGWIKADNSETGRAFLRLFLISQGQKVTGTRRTLSVIGDPNWQRVVCYVTVPPATDHASVYLELEGPGAASFDDISLETVPRPKGPAPPKDVLLITDLPQDAACRLGVTQAAGERLATVWAPAAFDAKAIPRGVAFIVVMLDQWPREGPLFPALKQFARSGGAVVMELSNFAAAQGLKCDRTPFADLPRLKSPFNGPAGRYSASISYLDSCHFISDMYLLVNGRAADHWLLDAPVTETEMRRAMTRAIKGITLAPGDTITLCTSQSGPESCAVEKIELARDGSADNVVIAADGMERADGYVVTTKAAPFKTAAQIDAAQAPTKQIEITAAVPATRGFHKGDLVYWHGGEVRQSIPDVSKLAGAIVLARWRDGGAVMIEQAFGRGRIVALDLAGAPEPYYRRYGGFNKYVFLSNVIGPGVRFGRYFPKKLEYAEFVVRMRSFAQSAKSVRMADEGPASEGYRLWSLNFGDPKKPAIFISAATHGSEWEPAYGVLCLAEYVAAHPEEKIVNWSRYSLKLVPILSPWAYDHSRRHTPQDIDPNRNSDYCWKDFSDKRDTTQDGEYGPGDYAWKGDAPFCVPETQTYKKIMDTISPYAVVEFHCAGWFVSLPATAKPDNVDRVEEASRLFSLEFTPRFVFQPRHCNSIQPYTLGPPGGMGRTPFLLQYGARGRYGMLVELPGTFSSNPSATLILSEMTAATAYSAIQAYTQ